MCGRFSLRVAHEEIEQLEGHDAAPAAWERRDAFVPRYNLAPHTNAPVLRRREHNKDELVLSTMRWGLIPHFAKFEDKNLNTTNARSENLIDGGGMWASIKGGKRCAVPCQGYYEWLTKGTKKTPHYIKPKDGRLMLMAGLWDVVQLRADQTEPLWTFSIVTTASGSALSWLHDRQPVMLDTPEALSTWLDTSSQKWTPELGKLLSATKSPLDCYAVPPEVGRVGVESPTFIEPVATRKDGIQAMFAKQTQAAKTKPSPSKAAATSSPKPPPSSSKQAEKRRRHDSDLGDDEIEILDRPPSPKKLAIVRVFIFKHTDLARRVFLFLLVTALSAILLTKRIQSVRDAFRSVAVPAQKNLTMSSTVPALETDIPTLQAAWRADLAALPSTPDNIPSFFFGHGSPMLVAPPSFNRGSRFEALAKWGGPQGALATFLKDFGPALLSKYKPKAIVVFSAHWETTRERLVTDYGASNPLLMDYYNFPPEMYDITFKSRGDSAIAQRVVQLFNAAGMPARLTPASEARGEDGRGFAGPGLDHGVFVPFSVMFGPELAEVPIIQASIDASLSPETNIAVGRALTQLRKEGVLLLSGGLTTHNLREITSFSPFSANDLHKGFDRAIVEALKGKDEEERKEKLIKLTQHPGFRASHPREEHFVPIYVALGAGEHGEAKLIGDLYGAKTVAFGL
ncbi:LigB domain-containing protein [Mycena chlorophos]|uniref:LigB domain-containing protein n=1 Tax=Mycena chlorophos TaxID=658473 RepID=A0A8H6WJK6_MYCCL|nr:LigB domain-containing protein [Mycena chlorophos]